MKDQVERLYQVSNKQRRRIIGLMSGTSLDGLDIALCSIKNSGYDTQLEVEKFETIPYDDDLKREVREIISKKYSPP